ncbi:TBC1 domain family member 10A [Anguilla rostrata]|uniref:TBC1 domain family member 10A n=1 Tax=Anguilla rostrata TaxID=7938 RepID=UPI0030CD1FC4
MRRRSSSSSGKCTSRRRNDSLGFDEFGFALSKKKDQKLQHRSHDYSYPQPNTVRVKELCELLSYWNGSSFICRNQIERFIRIGIPPALRGQVWKCLLSTDALRDTSSFSYQKCLREIRGPLVDLGVSEYSILSAIATLSETENEMGCAPSPPQPPEASVFSCSDVAIFRQIALDLQRSFPTHRSLMGDSAEAIEGQAKLFRVLTAYARYNPLIGYCQGMSYIAAVLLMNLAEEEAFWALVALLEKPKYLSGLFDHSLDKIQHQARVFHQLLKHRKPQLSQHIEDLGVSSLHFVMPWFLTLFTSLPCWDSVLAVWDLIMLQGLLAVFRVGLAVLELLEPRLLQMTDEGLMLPTLLRVPVEVSQHCVLVPALWGTEVQEWEIDCMNGLVLEETGEGRHQQEKESGPSTPRAGAEDGRRGKERPARTPATEARKPAKKEAGGGAKSVFARMLRTARRYLGDVGRGLSAESKPSPPKNAAVAAAGRFPRGARPSSSLTRVQMRSRKKSQRGTFQRSAAGRVKKAALPSQDSDGGVPDPGPEPALRRRSSGPVGRVARRRSSCHPPRGRSLRLLRPAAGTAPPPNPGTPPPDPADSPGASAFR